MKRVSMSTNISPRFSTAKNIAAMNTLGYEVGTLGNHEFNYGLEFLDAALAGATFPVVNANIVNPDGSPRFTPYRIVE